LCDECVPTPASVPAPRIATDAPVAVEEAAGGKLADTEPIEDGEKHALRRLVCDRDNVVTDRQTVMLLVLGEDD
jgi:hypothetical protein